jgi:dienelactone hydrolase
VDMDAYISRFHVPITVLQGEADNYYGCCNVERIRSIGETARKEGRDFELTIYPGAGHGFNLGPGKSKELDMDTWRKTTEALKKYLP